MGGDAERLRVEWRWRYRGDAETDGGDAEMVEMCREGEGAQCARPALGSSGMMTSRSRG